MVISRKNISDEKRGFMDLPGIKISLCLCISYEIIQTPPPPMHLHFGHSV